MSNSKESNQSLGAVVRTIETRTSIYTLHEDGVIVQRLRDNARQTLADAKENVEAYLTLCVSTKHPCLIDGRAALTAEPGVREYYARPEVAERTLAAALLVGSSAMRVIANLFLTVNKPIMPTRMFTVEHEALAWLRRMEQLTRQASK